MVACLDVFVHHTVLGYAVFITANISGGHLNPAVTMATMVTGHISIPRGLTYMFCQICGAAFGILIVVGPDVCEHLVSNYIQLSQELVICHWQLITNIRLQHTSLCRQDLYQAHMLVWATMVPAVSPLVLMSLWVG